MSGTSADGVASSPPPAGGEDLADNLLKAIQEYSAKQVQEERSKVNDLSLKLQQQQDFVQQLAEATAYPSTVDINSHAFRTEFVKHVTGLASKERNLPVISQNQGPRRGFQSTSRAADNGYLSVSAESNLGDPPAGIEAPQAVLDGIPRRRPAGRDQRFIRCAYRPGPPRITMPLHVGRIGAAVADRPRRKEALRNGKAIWVKPLKEKNVFCKVKGCKFQTNHLGRLRAHVNADHMESGKKLLDDLKKYRHSCPKCGLMFESDAEWRRHKRNAVADCKLVQKQRKRGGRAGSCPRELNLVNPDPAAPLPTVDRPGPPELTSVLDNQDHRLVPALVKLERVSTDGGISD